MHRPTSILTFALQYLSSLIFSGGSGRVKLLWMYQQDDTFDEYCVRAPDQLREFRRLVLVTAVGIYKRHSATMRLWDMKLVIFADPRVSCEQKAALGRAWDAVLWCCLPAGVARQLKKKKVTSAQLISCPVWQMFVSCHGNLPIASQQHCMEHASRNHFRRTMDAPRTYHKEYNTRFIDMTAFILYIYKKL